jgi:hypothetical protein
MVRIQFACGIGRRCESEIEIKGSELNVVKTGLMLRQIKPTVQRRYKGDGLTRK